MWIIIIIKEKKLFILDYCTKFQNKGYITVFPSTIGMLC